MKIPTPNEFAQSHGYKPFPARWEKWLSSVRESILSSKTTAGKHVTVGEHKGKGTVVNVGSSRERGKIPTGACCIGTDCSILTEADCLDAGGIYQGDSSLCDPNPCGSPTTGACCTSGVCTEGSNHDDCVAGGGIYLGNGTTCSGIDCSCCPILQPYTEVHFLGQVLGCTGGTINLPEKIWSKVPGFGLCVLTGSAFQFSADSDCGCQFNAQNCIPFTNVPYVEIDDVGDCSGSYGGCVATAQIFCDYGVVEFSASTALGVCCNVYAALGPSSPYDITAGPIDVTLNATSGDTSIQFRFILSLA